MRRLFIIYSLFFSQILLSQSTIGNYVSNGSFERLTTSSVSTFYGVVQNWGAIDSSSAADYLCTLIPPNGNSPYCFGFQYPKSGKNYIGTQFYGTRGYPRNRLKTNLKAGTTYCAKFFIVNTNNSPIATDGAAMYFADASLDTINYCNVALSYLVPQIQNPIGNVITDTLRWVPVTGTFVANGTEKYLVIGNFRTDANTTTLSLNSTFTNVVTSDVCIDDVSVIEMNLPAYAGRDTTVLPGSPVFLGREPDFATDSGCVWYQWPNLTTPIDTVSGFWVNPVVTTTYVVKQVLDCSPEKWDTVVVRVDATVGNSELKIGDEGLRVFPNPAEDQITIVTPQESEEFTLQIRDLAGRMYFTETLKSKNYLVKLNINLYNGVYIVRATNKMSEISNFKLIVNK